MGQIKQKTTVKIRATSHSPSHSRSDVEIRGLIVTIDEPIERDGTNAGTSPTETALAALIGCTNVIGHKCANRLDIAIGHLDIDAVCDFDRRGVTLTEEIDVPFTALTLTVTADGPASQQELDQVAAEVAKYCPLSKLYEAAGTEVTTIWRKG